MRFWFADAGSAGNAQNFNYFNYKGKRISGKIDRESDREVIKNIQLIFQNPTASLSERAMVDYAVYHKPHYSDLQGYERGTRRNERELDAYSEEREKQ